MRKFAKYFGILLIILTLSGCENAKEVTIPDFHGMPYGDAVMWAKDNDVNIVVSSEYSDDVLPNTIISQGIVAGESVKVDSDLTIVYSRGYSPDGEVVVPDFSEGTLDDIIAWLVEYDIDKYDFLDTFDLDKAKGEYVGFEVNKSEDRTETLRKDSFTFYFSRGPIEIEEVAFTNSEAIRGVNLGGWFVLEGWMTPTLFEGIDGSDETIFMEEKENAAVVLEEHWNTFITEEDFEFLSEHDVDYVRIPIPWWFRGDTFEYTHEGITHNVTYANSVFYIERAMEWAEKYDIKVLLDLHTAPGCQNGFDNGGISGVLQWEQEANVAKTIEVLKDITTHFSTYDSLWGIELLNEPGWVVDLDLLQDFYIDAYIAIRTINYEVWVGMHDGFRMYMESEWGFFFTHNSFYKVFFDIHLYQTFGDGWGDYDIFDHLEWVEVEQYKAVHRYDGIVPVIVGEWSLGLQGNVYEDLSQESIRDLKIAYGNKQLNVYEHGMGWFFWNYKIDQGTHMEWDMKRLIENGIFPESFKTE